MYSNPSKVTSGDRVSLTVDEAAASIGSSRATLYPLLTSGEIPSFTIGRRRFVPMDGLQAFVDRRVQAAQVPVPPDESKRMAAAGRNGRAAQLLARK